MLLPKNDEKHWNSRTDNVTLKEKQVYRVSSKNEPLEAFPKIGWK